MRSSTLPSIACPPSPPRQVDNFLSRLILHEHLRALVCEPMLCTQEAPYEGDIARSGFGTQAVQTPKGRGVKEANSWHTSSFLPQRADESLYH